MNSLNYQEIQKILPHRYPFLLIDQVSDYQPGSWAKAQKCVSGNEPFFQGHFPAEAIMPGVLVLEALAQTGAIALLSEPENAGQIVYFGGVKNARFRHPVRPGDILLLECNLTKRRGAVGFGQGIAMVNDKIACSAEISFIISQQQNEQIA